ncbi:putative membrane protein [plant metagenome]|uniref:Putative membrane protein n=1 Tax=plant metagenome TaxID=1297885 RepID=A0A484PKC9_9ZZZZ
MIGEFNLYGVYLPWLLVLAFATLLCARLLRRVLARVGFYRHVWHPALFDLALFVVLLYAAAQVSPLILSSTS